MRVIALCVALANAFALGTMVEWYLFGGEVQWWPAPICLGAIVYLSAKVLGCELSMGKYREETPHGQEA